MLGEHVVEFPTCARQKWQRDEIASKLAQAREALAGGSSEVEVSERLNIPRSTLRYWLSRKDHLDGSKNVAEFFESSDGLALLHRIVMAMHGSVMYSSHGIRGVCTALERSGLSRFVATRLLEPLRSADSPLRSLDSETFENVERVARECANIFQRSSSCVEGRNGQLALHHHSLHKIRPRKLRALTVVHHYYRPSGPTPAERLFRTQHEDLFTWLADHVDLPARPARKRPRPFSPATARGSSLTKR